jgi:tRNA uridine 5-carboxymethylaminomethyl modification enzyme
MFTSRAEFRTLLRQDNADLRLTERSHHLGLASAERIRAVEQKIKEVNEVKKTLNNYSIEPTDINAFLQSINSAPIQEKQKAAKIILRPNISLDDLTSTLPSLQTSLDSISEDALLQAEIQIKYERYIEKEQQLVDKMSDLENMAIPANFDYDKLNALSSEALQKMKKIKPSTLGQASRISGVNPSDIQILMVYMGR